MSPDTCTDLDWRKYDLVVFTELLLWKTLFYFNRLWRRLSVCSIITANEHSLSRTITSSRKRYQNRLILFTGFRELSRNSLIELGSASSIYVSGRCCWQGVFVSEKDKIVTKILCLIIMHVLNENGLIFAGVMSCHSKIIPCSRNEGRVAYGFSRMLFEQFELYQALTTKNLDILMC